MSKNEKIVVLGAGINGLCSTLKLLQLGYQVDLLAQDFTPNTWSDAASAVWMQFKAQPMSKVVDWLYQTYNWCQMLEKDNQSGVQLLPYREYHREKNVLPYFLSDIHYPYQPIPESDLNNYACGFQAELYRLDSTLMLPYLVKQIKNNGGKLLRQYVASFHDKILRNYSIIVNCTGAANYPLTHDMGAFPISGHYLLLEKIKGINTIHLSLLDDNHYLAIVSRTQDIWLGGTAVEGWDSQMNHRLLQEIYEQCTQIEPRLSKTRILKTGIGFRSGRSEIRVEKELFANQVVIHNYGQGGSGFSLCWGCAEEVASLVAASTA